MTVQKSSMRGLPSDDKILVTTSLLCFVIQTSSWWDLNTLLSAHVGSDTASLTVAPYLTLILITGPEPTDRWATNDFQDRNWTSLRAQISGSEKTKLCAYSNEPRRGGCWAFRCIDKTGVHRRLIWGSEQNLTSCSGEGIQGFWWRYSGILVKAFGVQQWSHLWCLSLLCFEGEMSPTGWVFEQFIPRWRCYLGRYGRLRWGSLGISAWGWGSEVLYPSPLSICPLLPDYRHNVTRASLSCCMQYLQCLCRPDCTLWLWAKITLLSLSCFCRVISYSNKKTNKNILKNTEIGTQGVSSHLKERIKFVTTDPSFLCLMALDLGHSPKGKGIHDGCGNHGAHHCCYWYKQCILSIRQVRPLL